MTENLIWMVNCNFFGQKYEIHAWKIFILGKERRTWRLKKWNRDTGEFSIKERI